jgi:hypothetical protein
VATAGTVVFTNTFKVTGNQLVCTYNGVDYPLIAANTSEPGVLRKGDIDVH